MINRKGVYKREKRFQEFIFYKCQTERMGKHLISDKYFIYQLYLSE